MYLTTFGKFLLKYVQLILLIFSLAGSAWKAALKMTKVKLDLLTNIDMLLLVEKGIRGRKCHAIHRYM